MTIDKGCNEADENESDTASPEYSLAAGNRGKAESVRHPDDAVPRTSKVQEGIIHWYVDT